MKLLDARVNWSLAFDNPPRFELLVDRIMPLEDHRYVCRDGLYYSHHKGLCSFFYEDPVNHNGYGGRTFPIRMVGGELVELHGPWSSRAACVNARFLPHCVDAHITDSADSFKKGYTFYTGSVSVAIAEQAARICGVDLVRIPLERDVHPSEYRTWCSGGDMECQIGSPDMGVQYGIYGKIKHMEPHDGKPGWFHVSHSAPGRDGQRLIVRNTSR